jgi:hypothetical protein
LPAQVRSWNLSDSGGSVAGQTAWLKVVPGFFAHEGALLARLAGERVPRLLGHDGGRSLLAEIPGEDLYGAGLQQLLEMVSLLVEIQFSWRDRVAELLALGLPDWREPALCAAIADTLERTADELSADDRTSLARFVCGLPDRIRRIAGCGIGDTLIHGDFHPGNFRGDGNALTLLDWSDSGVGHPLLDQPAFLAWVPAVSGHNPGPWQAGARLAGRIRRAPPPAPLRRPAGRHLSEFLRPHRPAELTTGSTLPDCARAAVAYRTREFLTPVTLYRFCPVLQLFQPHCRRACQ